MYNAAGAWLDGIVDTRFINNELVAHICSLIYISYLTFASLHSIEGASVSDIEILPPLLLYLFAMGL